MKILSIETSCDETAISVVEAEGGLENPQFTILGNVLHSQIDIHTKYGGVFPMLAKREHAKNLPFLLVDVLKQAGLYEENENIQSDEKWLEIRGILSKEQGLEESLRKILEKIARPNIDMIAVTVGPGLAPALWVGISCAKALGIFWNIPVIPANHMEGHILSVLINETNIKTDVIEKEKKESESRKDTIKFPALALLISGGHTEIVKIEKWGKYNVIGETRDDAVGEAFDKVARMLGLPYPGGPEISKLAEEARKNNIPNKIILPRPMIHSGDLNFSFSGLKTAVLYHIRDHGELNEEEKRDMAREFEDAVMEVILKKTKNAVEETGAKTLIIAGGVIANKKIRETFLNLEKEMKDIVVKIPTQKLSTDNALMIAVTGYINTQIHKNELEKAKNTEILAKSNLKLS